MFDPIELWPEQRAYRLANLDVTPYVFRRTQSHLWVGRGEVQIQHLVDASSSGNTLGGSAAFQVTCSQLFQFVGKFVNTPISIFETQTFPTFLKDSKGWEINLKNQGVKPLYYNSVDFGGFWSKEWRLLTNPLCGFCIVLVCTPWTNEKLIVLREWEPDQRAQVRLCLKELNVEEREFWRNGK
jgi:hypothetical protein